MRLLVITCAESSFFSIAKKNRAFSLKLLRLNESRVQNILTMIIRIFENNSKKYSAAVAHFAYKTFRHKEHVLFYEQMSYNEMVKNNRSKKACRAVA